MIVLAAIRKDNIVYVGKVGERHNHILCDKTRSFGFLKFGEQGFVTDLGEFLNREDAAQHAYDCKQLVEKKKRLFSEDLW